MSRWHQEFSREQLDTVRLLLAGLCAGDCLGSTTEFQPQSQVPEIYAKLSWTGWPFRQVGGGVLKWKKGQSTDDGDQAMCLVRSYLDVGHFDPVDVGRRLVEWLNTGPADVGGTTRRTLAKLRSGAAFQDSGLDDYLAHPDNAANGSLMRNGVIAGLLFGRSLHESFRATVQHSIITHYHPLPVLCCAAQTWIIADELSAAGRGPCHKADWLDAFYEDWTAYMAKEDDPAVGTWLGHVLDQLPSAAEALSEADFNPHTFDPFRIEYRGRAGYCLLSLQIGVWALRWSKSDEPFPVPAGFPEEVFQRRGPWTIGWPAMIGHDSDTYGAIAGPMVAAAHGTIPADLTDHIAFLDEYDRMVATLR